MKSFNYVIKDDLGIHARPAGMLVKVAAKCKSSITIVKDGKSADARKAMAIMMLGVKNGNEVSVTVEGEDEEAAFEAVKSFFEANL